MAGTMSLAELGLTAPGGREVRVTGLSLDSRQVQPGHLFGAMPGSAIHGGAYVEAAVLRGAAAILTDAPYLILDEPLNGLDPEGIQWVRDFIKDYVSDHRTVIVSSHYMAELELVTDHVVGLSNGRKVLDGDIAALLDQYGSLEQAYFNVVKK